MEETFGTKLREFREEVGISQKELANRLSISETLLSKWENNKSLPSREMIVRISQELKLEDSKRNILLSLSHEEELPSKETTDKDYFKLIEYSFKIDKQDLEKYDMLSTFLNSTGTAMGGTIDNLSDRLSAIERNITFLKHNIKSEEKAPQIDFVSELNNRINPIIEEVTSIKNTILPELEKTKDEISSYETFVKDNVDFLRFAVEAQGLMKGLQGQVDALAKRLEKVESQVNLSRERRIAFITTIIAIISTSILVYTTFFQRSPSP